MVECVDCSVDECMLDGATDLTGYRKKIFDLRYAFDKNEKLWETACNRVAKAVGLREDEKVIAEFEKIMTDSLFVPGGRVLRNASRNKGMLINCYALGVDDNIESIAELYKDALMISSTGGGIGINFSNLRPVGTPIVGKGGCSSGVVSFMKALNSILSTVELGGQRRAACIGILRIDHPEIYKFISSKVEEGELQNFNISIGITDKFLKAVKNNQEWDLVFKNKVYDTVKAIDLWGYIVKNLWGCGDPGLINLDTIARYNPLWYVHDVYTLNPCGEIPLPVYGSCCLGSINLSEMYDEKTSDVDWNKLEHTIGLAVRFLDDVLDVSHYPLSTIELNAHQTRQIGLGVMGLHYLMLKMGIEEYGSEKSLEFMDSLFLNIRDYAYNASIGLARERGSFEKFNAEKHLEGEFVKRLPRRIRSGIKKHGLRNGTILSMQPTGTTSIIAGVSNGVEPIFCPIYKRYYNANNNDGETEMASVVEMDELFREKIIKGEPHEYFVGGYDISPREHMEVQITAQQYIDSAISKTILLKKDFPCDELGGLLLEHLHEVKGVTMYREGSKMQEILIPMDYKLSDSELLKIANGGSDKK